MFLGISPKKVQAMMKRMGIAQEEISANRVIIEKDDGNVIINNPSVVKVNMQGQTNFQISGDIEEQEAEQDNNTEDIKTIMEKVGCLEQEAKMALEKANGDLTEAILSLS